MALCCLDISVVCDLIITCLKEMHIEIILWDELSGFVTAHMAKYLHHILLL